MKRRQVFRSSLSFTKGDVTRACLTAGVGFNLPIQVLGDSKSNFSRQVFGLSDTNKFYPDLNVPSSLAPKPEDFIDAPFRLISATIVAGETWRATDFSKGNVLKDNLAKLEGKPVYKDHYTDLDNWVGLVKVPKWTEAFTDAKGNKIPGGIDAIISIDGKTNPKIARGVLCGGIFSNSVTVDFDWVPSHDIENQYEFEDRVGTYAEDGRMIVREVVTIHDFYESSLVWLGADPYAKLIDKNGDLVNPDLTSTYSNESDETKDTYKNQGRYDISLAFNKNVLHLAKYNKPTNENSNTPMDEQLLIALRAMLGLAADAEVTPEMIATLQVIPTDAPDAEVANKAANFSKLAKIEMFTLGSDKKVTLVADEAAPVDDTFTAGVVSLSKTDLATLQASHNTLAELKIGDAAVTKESLTALITERDQLAVDKKALEDTATADEKFTTQGKKFVQLQQTEAVRLYKLQAGDKASPAVEKLFTEADPDAIEGLLNQYSGSVTSKFAGRCKKCQSTEFEFKSSISTADEGITQTQTEEVDNSGVSFTDIHAKYDKPLN